MLKTYDRLRKINEDMIEIQKKILDTIDSEVFVKGAIKDLKIQALSLYEDFVKLENKLLGDRS